MKKQLILLILLAFAKGYTSEIEQLERHSTIEPSNLYKVSTTMIEIDEPIDKLKNIDNKTRANLTTAYLHLCDLTTEINNGLFKIIAKDENLPFVHPVEAYQYILQRDNRLFNPEITKLSFKLDKGVVQNWLLGTEGILVDEFDKQFSSTLEDLKKWGYGKLERLPANISLVLLYTIGQIKPEQVITKDGEKKSVIKATIKQIQELVAPHLDTKNYYGC